MPQIRQEINLWVNAAGSGAFTSTSIDVGAALAQLDTSQYISPTYYFEVVAKVDTNSGTNNLKLRRNGTTTDDATCTITSTSYARVRSSSFTPPVGATEYLLHVNASSGRTVTLTAARLVVIDAGVITQTETQIELGYYPNLISFPLYKYWNYTAAHWDGTVSFFFEAVCYASTGYTATATLSQDDGSFNNWTVVATAFLGNPGVWTRVRTSAFVPLNGRHYRVDQSGSGTVGTSVYFGASKIVVQSSGLFTTIEPQYLILNYQSTQFAAVTNCLQSWDPAEWSVVSNVYMFQQDVAPFSDGLSNCKLQVGGSDVSGSSITGADQVTSSALTMPSSGTMDSYIVTNNSGIGINATRLLVLSTVRNVYTSALSDSVSLTSSKTVSALKTNAEALALAEALVRSLNQVQSDSVVLASLSLQQKTSPRSDAFSIVDSQSQVQGRFATEAFTLNEIYKNQTTKPLTDVASFLETVNSSITKTPLLDTVSLVDIFAKQPQKVGSETFSFAEAFLRANGKRLTESVSLIEAYAQRTQQNAYLDVYTLSDNSTSARVTSVFDSLTFAEAIVLSTSRSSLNDFFVLADSYSKATGRVFLDTLVFVETLQRVLVPKPIPTDVLTLVSVLVPQVQKNVLDVFSFVESRNVALTTSRTDVLALVENFTKRSIPLLASEALTLAEAFTRSSVKSVLDVVSFGEEIKRQTQPSALSDVLGFAEFLNRTPKRGYVDAVSLVDVAVSFAPVRFCNDVLALLDLATRITTRVIGIDVCALGDVITLLALKLIVLSDALSFSETLHASTQRTVSDALSYAEFLLRTLQRAPLSDGIVLSDSRGNLLLRIFSETVSLLDRIVHASTRSAADVLSLLDTLNRAFPPELFLETLLVLDSSVRSFQRKFAEVFAFAEVLVHVSALSFGEVFGLNDTYSNRIQHQRLEILNLSDTLIHIRGEIMLDVLSFVEVRTLLVARQNADAIALVEIFNRHFPMLLLSSIPLKDTILVVPPRGLPGYVAISNYRVAGRRP